MVSATPGSSCQSDPGSSEDPQDPERGEKDAPKERSKPKLPSGWLDALREKMKKIQKEDPEIYPLW
jgi:hypothetical protein